MRRTIRKIYLQLLLFLTLLFPVYTYYLAQHHQQLLPPYNIILWLISWLSGFVLFGSLIRLMPSATVRRFSYLCLVCVMIFLCALQLSTTLFVYETITQGNDTYVKVAAPFSVIDNGESYHRQLSDWLMEQQPSSTFLRQ